MTNPTPRTLLDDREISRALARMAHQVVELNRGTDGLVLLGIPTRGAPLARRLAAAVESVEDGRVEVGEIDTTMYRDDLRRHPTMTVGRSHVPVALDDRTVVLVDDVLQSGRTVQAALEALKDLGRPARVMLAVLVDRGHRELPVQADVVGLQTGTARDERVSVRLTETDGEDLVTISREMPGHEENR